MGAKEVRSFRIDVPATIDELIHFLAAVKQRFGGDAKVFVAGMELVEGFELSVEGES